jgi:hypothetical protein
MYIFEEIQEENQEPEKYACGNQLYIRTGIENSLVNNKKIPKYLFNDQFEHQAGLKKIFESILSVLVLMFIVGCTNESPEPAKIDVTVNSSFSTPEELNLRKIFFLDSSSVKNPINIVFDSDRNLYIQSYNSPSVKVFNENGEFIKDFNTVIENSKISSVNIINDTIFFTYPKEKKVLRYKKDGSFVSETASESEILRLETIGDNRMIGTFKNSMISKQDLFFSIKLKIVDSAFRQISLISSFSGTYYSSEIDYEIETFPFAVDESSEVIYIGFDSDSEYNIYCYSYDMKLLRIIKNDIPPVRFTEKEIESRKQTAHKFRIPFIKSEKKIFIESMTMGFEGDLYVRRAADAGIYGIDNAVFDVFDANGKNKRSFLIKNASRSSSVIFNEKIIYVTDPIRSEISAYEIPSSKGGAK